MQEKEDKLNRVRAILSMNRAMWGEISPTLRAIQISWNTEKIYIFYYYDGEIADEDRFSAECISTEMMAGYPDYELEENIIQWNYPKPIPDNGELVYMRRESSPEK